jgi:hypothetical protein
MPPAPVLQIDPQRLRSGPWREHLPWEGFEYATALKRIAFGGLAAGARVTVIGVQRGDSLVPMYDTTDGVNGIKVVVGDAPHGESLDDPWPSGGVQTLLWIALGGLLLAFVRARDALLGCGAIAVIVGIGASGGDAAAGASVGLALAIVGLLIASLPRSPLVACTVALATAAVIAVVRATESVADGFVVAGAAIALIALARIDHGWHRSISWQSSD